MAGGPILPSSLYLGGGSGSLFPSYYVPATNTNAAGQIEGVGVAASLGIDVTAVIQYIMPEVIPSGQIKLRCLAMCNATSGVAKFTVADGATSAGSNIGATTLTSETQVSQTWATADILVENKVSLTTSPTANQVLTIAVTFNHTSWTLANVSTWLFSIVWE
jgi:hypothetical protein